MKKRAMINVSRSAAGKNQRRPSSPKTIGRMRETPKRISRVMETAVEAKALPMALRFLWLFRGINSKERKEATYAGIAIRDPRSRGDDTEQPVPPETLAEILNERM